MKPFVAPTARPAIAMPSIRHEGIALHDHAVGKGAAVALVGVADDVFLRRPAPSATVSHLMPVGKPAPPRPRRPEVFTSSTISIGCMRRRASRGPS